jgi:nucleoside-diphosphate-sugar epimerase
MKILVTGGTGFVGSHLVEKLLTQDHSVVCLVRDQSKAERLFTREKPQFVVGDLDATDALSTAARGVEAVFHVAGLTAARSRADFHRVNVQGTQTLVRIVAAKAKDVQRFVHVSSLAACGPTPDGVAANASSKPQPVSQYGWSKLAGEEAVRRSDLPWVIIRPPTVYGPRDTELFRIFKLARTGLVPVLGTGEQSNSFVYIADLVDALAACLNAPEKATYFPSHPGIYTQRELVHHVSRALSEGATSARVIGVPELVARSSLWLTGTFARLLGRATLLNADRANDFLASAWVCSSAELERDTGWRPETDLPNGLALTAQWYRQHGWL